MRRLTMELEARVQARTLELEESNAALEAFGYSVSHDLRAPLRTMQGFARALMEDHAESLAPEAKDYALRITRGAERMDALIEDLLAYSRLSRADITLQPVDLNVVLRDVAMYLASEVRESSVTLDIEPDLPHVLGHRATLVQIFSNLVSNALKFVRHGVIPNIQVSATRDQAWVRVSVRDNGIGIDQAHLERIFQLFERLHGEEAYPGTGIGLAIVKKGTERLGGRVAVDSTPGEGSTFRIELNEA